MEKARIKFKEEVVEYLNQLTLSLFNLEYFSYLENAIAYKNRIIHFIEYNINTLPHRITPTRLKHLGSKYIFYKSNKRTTWYVFFEQKEQNYLITYITNNFSEDVKWL